MGAENVMGLYWRTAAYVLALTSDRKQLAINGNPKWLPKSYEAKGPTHNWTYYTYKYYLRNYAVADTILDIHSPPELKAALKALGSIKKTGESLREETFRIVEHNAPVIARKIQNLKGIPATTKGFAIEQVFGMDITLNAGDVKDSATKDVSCKVSWPFKEKLRWAGKDAEDAYAKSHPFPVKGIVSVVDDKKLLDKAIAFELDSTKNGTRWSDQTWSSKVSVTCKATDKTAIPVRFKYTIGDIAVEYVRPLHFNLPQSLIGRNMSTGERRFKVPGTVVRDAITQELVFRLPNSVVLGLMRPEAFPVAFTGLDGKSIPDMDTRGYVQEGDNVVVDYVTYSVSTGVYKALQLTESAVKTIAIKDMRFSNLAPQNAVTLMMDSNHDTVFSSTIGDEKQPASIEVSFGSPQNVNGCGVWAAGKWWETFSSVMLEAKVDGKWKIVYRGPRNGSIRFPMVTTDRFRVTVAGKKTVRIKELQFTSNPRRTGSEHWIWRTH
jgi:hypothetical protein